MYSPASGTGKPSTRCDIGNAGSSAGEGLTCSQRRLRNALRRSRLDSRRSSSLLLSYAPSRQTRRSRFFVHPHRVPMTTQNSSCGPLKAARKAHDSGRDRRDGVDLEDERAGRQRHGRGTTPESGSRRGGSPPSVVARVADCTRSEKRRPWLLRRHYSHCGSDDDGRPIPDGREERRKLVACCLRIDAACLRNRCEQVYPRLAAGDRKRTGSGRGSSSLRSFAALVVRIRLPPASADPEGIAATASGSDGTGLQYDLSGRARLAEQNPESEYRA